MVSHIINICRLNSIATLLFFVVIITFPRSYLALKLISLVFFLIISLLANYQKIKFTTYPRLNIYYFLVAFAGAFWSLIGLVNGGHEVGISDSFRLYVIWSMAYLTIYTFLRSEDALNTIHLSIVLSGILIAIINFYGLYDMYFNLGSISESFRKELELDVGIHDAYIQINSHNIASLFIILPYLISIQFRQDASKKNSILVKIAFILCLLITIVSGRRALWMCAAITPFVIIILSYITSSMNLLKNKGKYIIMFYIFTSLIGLAFAFYSQMEMTDSGFFAYFNSAFSAEDERSIQKAYLTKSFYNYPYLGSGLGVSAIIPRNIVAPWQYESTYYQMLFNLGIVGILYLASIMCVYFYFVVKIIKNNKLNSFVPFCLLVALIDLLIGAYSNPYLASFDSLIFMGLLPYLSTFRHGYTFSVPDKSLAITSQYK